MSTATNTPLPPMLSGGLPVIGHVVEMVRDRQGLFKRGFAEHGNIFRIKLANQDAVVISGAEYNREFYTQTDKTLTMKEGYTFLVEALGEILFTASKEEYYNQRPLLQEIFRRERMVGYIQAMQNEVQRWLDSLGESGEFDFTKAMQNLTQSVAGHALIGKNFRDELDDQFWENYAVIGRSLDAVIPPNLPLPKFKQRDRANREIKATFKQMIERRRQNPDQYNDLITTVFKTEQKDGTILSDDKIVNLFMALIFAGHETTAGQAAWLVTLLLQHPDYLALVKDEIKANVAYGQAFDGSTLSKLTHIYWAIDETTRLYPSADTQLRIAAEPIQFGEYVLPKGWRIMTSGVGSHYMPDVFTNPQQFDPFRWSDERNEGKNTYSIMGFGGGIHKCTGMNFAKNEMAIITSLFFQQFDVELLSKEVHIVTGAGANRPSEVRVRYRRKPLTELTDAKTIKEAAAAGCPHITQHLANENL